MDPAGVIFSFTPPTPADAYVLGSDPEAPEEVQSLIGLTLDELGFCQSRDADLAFILIWLEVEKKPEEGELFLTNPAVRIITSTRTRNLFILDDHKVIWRKSRDDGFGGPPGA